ncbi:MAG: hypothetical protein QOE36_2082, partial [Gaiellaceae bacterium]|nr:hypothetical protein [Gaiellaceae bacterium]
QPAPPPAELARGADDDAERRERRRGVQRALGLLPPDQRQVLELAYYAGLTQSQIASQLRQPVGTIKSRTHAALAAARALLTGTGVAHAEPSGPRAVATVGAGGVAFAARPDA